MKRAQRALVVYLSTLFVVAALMAFSTSSTATRSGTQLARTANPASTADLADLLGSWSGTWNDTIYSVGGSLSFEITEDAGVYSATGDIGLQSLSFGVVSGTASGSEDLGELIFTFFANTLGGGAGSIDATTGAASGAGSITPPLGFGAFAFEGAASGNVMSGMFDFLSPTGGAGVASLTRTANAVEQKPWSDLKLQYRDDAIQDN